jgi:hypothetical protein
MPAGCEPQGAALVRLNQKLAANADRIPPGVIGPIVMALTAAAMIVGAAVILFDPIFQGLAISLMAGEVASLLLSRMAVPVLYYMAKRHERSEPVPTLSRVLRITFGDGPIAGVEVIADRAQLDTLEIAPIPATTSGRSG